MRKDDPLKFLEELESDARTQYEEATLHALRARQRKIVVKCQSKINICLIILGICIVVNVILHVLTPWI